MNRTSLALASLALATALAAGRAEAQTDTQPQTQPTEPTCPPGQPCVVVVPQQTQPQIVQPQVVQPQPQPQVVQPQVVQPQPYQAQGYVTVQPGQPQQQVVYAQPQRQPVEVTRTRLRWGLVGPGIALLAGGWFGNWLTGLVGWLGLSSWEDAGDYIGWSFVPVLGPWVNSGYFAGDPTRDGLFGMHILWGVLQAGGLLMCILGTVLQEEVTEIRYVEGPPRDEGPQVAVMPWADQFGAGASLSVTGF